MIKLRDVMTRDVVTFDVETTLIEAIEVLAERHISGAPVMKGERVVGVLTSTDIFEFLATNPVATTEFGEHDADNVLSGHTVGEAMSGGPACSLPPDAPVMSAAELMRQANVHRVFVMDNDRLVGVVTSLDVTRALAKRQVETRRFVFPNGASN